MRSKILLSILSFFLVLSSSFVRAEAPVAIGSKPPNFSALDQNGKTIQLSDYAGKIVVLEWTNPGCPFVRRHYKAGTMASLSKKYSGKGVAWLAVNSTNSTSVAKDKEWADEQKIQYPVLDDHDGKIGKIFGAKTTPHMFVIDGTGTLVYRGAIDDDPDGDKEAHAVNYVDRALTESLESKKIESPETKSYGCSVKYDS